MSKAFKMKEKAFLTILKTFIETNKTNFFLMWDSDSKKYYNLKKDAKSEVPSKCDSWNFLIFEWVMEPLVWSF